VEAEKAQEKIMKHASQNLTALGQPERKTKK